MHSANIIQMDGVQLHCVFHDTALTTAKRHRESMNYHWRAEKREVLL